jgi:propanediol dehydratase large subunit
MVTEDVAEMLVERLADGLRTCPRAAADALKAIVEEARRRAEAGDFLSIRALADRADDAVEQVKAEAGLHRPAGWHGSDKRLATLAMLAQQVFAVLAIMGGSDGERDSGYYRASLAHAQRLDAMTEGTLCLVELVNLVGESANQ